MCDPFVKAVAALLNGGLHVQDLCRAVVGDAVSIVLRDISRDYGLSYADLLKRYEKSTLSACFSDASVSCRGTTKGGKQCTRRACVRGYCYMHRDQSAEQDAKRRRVEAYADSMAQRSDPAARMAKVLCAYAECPAPILRKCAADLL